MSTVDWSQFKCRCSAIGKLLAASRSNPCLTELQAKKLDDYLKREKPLTENQKLEVADLLVRQENSKKVILSDGCIEYLTQHYSWETVQKVSISKEMDVIEYTEKGKLVEEESITLLSLIDEVFYRKNDTRITNDFLSGEPDIYIGEEVMKATKICDIKSVWDYPTFLKKLHAGIDSGYELQLQGYMDITGAKDGEIAYCLVNMPPIIVNDYRRRLLYKMNVATEEAPEYLEAVAILEKSLYFDDIDRKKRVFKVKVEPFTSEEKTKVYDRVKVCRDWLYKFDEQYQKLNEET